jgi:hypothetical protein
MLSPASRLSENLRFLSADCGLQSDLCLCNFPAPAFQMDVHPVAIRRENNGTTEG